MARVPVSRRRRFGSLATPFILLSLLAVLSGALLLASAVVVETRLIGVDMGGLYSKTAAYSVRYTASHAGTPEVNMVLNAQANRKSPSCIALRYVSSSSGSGELQLERSFAEPAEALLYRFPLQTICFPRQVLKGPAELFGKHPPSGTSALGSDEEKRVLTRFDNNIFIAHPLRPSTLVLIPLRSEKAREELPRWLKSLHPGDMNALLSSPNFSVFSPEEVLSMFLRDFKELAEKSDAQVNRLPPTEYTRLKKQFDQPASTNDDAAAPPDAMLISRLALVIPASLSVAERQALLDAATISGLRTERLMHSSTATLYRLLYLKGSSWVSVLQTLAYAKQQAKRAESLPTNTAALQSTEVYWMLFEEGYSWTEVSVYALSRTPPGLQVGTDALARRLEKLHNGTVREEDDEVMKGVEVYARRIASRHTEAFGGKSFDACIVGYWNETLLAGTVSAEEGGGHVDIDRIKDRMALLRAAEDARERLSVNTEVPVNVERVRLPGTEKTFSTTLDRSTFETQCASLFENVIELASDTWKEVQMKESKRMAKAAERAQNIQRNETANVNASSATTFAPTLQRIDVTGAASRMPKLIMMLNERFGLRGRLTSAPTLVAEEEEEKHSSHDGVEKKESREMVQRALNADEAAVLGITTLVGLPSGTGEGGSSAGSASLLLSKTGPYRVEEALTNNVYVQLSPSSGEGFCKRGSQALKLLFPKFSTTVPATYSLRLPNRTSPFVVSLYSPPSTPLSESKAMDPLAGSKDDEQQEREWLSQHIENAMCHRPKGDPTDFFLPIGTFARHAYLSDVDLVMQAVEDAALRDSNANETYRLEYEVVERETIVEVSVSESGVPFVSRAYVNVRLQRLTSELLTLPFGAADPQEDVEEVEEAVVEAPVPEVEGEDHETTTAVPEGSAKAEEPDASSEAKPLEAKIGEPKWVVTFNATHERSFLLEVKEIEGGDTVHLPLSDAGKRKDTGKNMTIVLPQGSNLRASEKLQAFERLEKLSEEERDRHRRVDLRNTIESVLLGIRTSSMWEEVREVMEADPAVEQNRIRLEKLKALWVRTRVVDEDDMRPSSEHDSPQAWVGAVGTLTGWIEDGKGEEADLAELENMLQQTLGLQQKLQLLTELISSGSPASEEPSEE